jgi:hypothetical protein
LIGRLAPPVKVVKIAGAKAYQYTAIDDCTQLRVLRLYRQLNVRSSLEFLSEIVRVFPFPIRRLQTDRGTEFSFTFLLAPSCWPSNAVASGITTSNPAGRTRTAQSSGATGSMLKSSGAA